MAEQLQPEWFKSTYSGSPNNECVECATNLSQAVLVRDSMDPDGPHLRFRPEEWRAFIGAVAADALRWC